MASKLMFLLKTSIVLADRLLQPTRQNKLQKMETKTTSDGEAVPRLAESPTMPADIHLLRQQH